MRELGFTGMTIAPQGARRIRWLGVDIAPLIRWLCAEGNLSGAFATAAEGSALLNSTFTAAYNRLTESYGRSVESIKGQDISALRKLTELDTAQWAESLALGRNMSLTIVPPNAIYPTSGIGEEGRRGQLDQPLLAAVRNLLLYRWFPAAMLTVDADFSHVVEETMLGGLDLWRRATQLSPERLSSPTISDFDVDAWSVGSSTYRPFWVHIVCNEVAAIARAGRGEYIPARLARAVAAAAGLVLAGPVTRAFVLAAAARIALHWSSGGGESLIPPDWWVTVADLRLEGEGRDKTIASQAAGSPGSDRSTLRLLAGPEPERTAALSDLVHHADVILDYARHIPLLAAAASCVRLTARNDILDVTLAADPEAAESLAKLSRLLAWNSAFRGRCRDYLKGLAMYVSALQQNIKDMLSESSDRGQHEEPQAADLLHSPLLPTEAQPSVLVRDWGACFSTSPCLSLGDLALAEEVWLWRLNAWSAPAASGADGPSSVGRGAVWAIKLGEPPDERCDSLALGDIVVQPARAEALPVMLLQGIYERGLVAHREVPLQHEPSGTVSPTERSRYVMVKCDTDITSSLLPTGPRRLFVPVLGHSLPLTLPVPGERAGVSLVGSAPFTPSMVFRPDVWPIAADMEALPDLPSISRVRVYQGGPTLLTQLLRTTQLAPGTQHVLLAAALGGARLLLSAPIPRLEWWAALQLVGISRNCPYASPIQRPRVQRVVEIVSGVPGRAAISPVQEAELVEAAWAFMMQGVAQIEPIFRIERGWVRSSSPEGTPSATPSSEQGGGTGDVDEVSTQATRDTP